MTRIQGPIDYSGGYPPRHGSPRRRLSTPPQPREAKPDEAGPSDDAQHASRDFVLEARRHRRVRHRARRVRMLHDDDANLIGHDVHPHDADRFARGPRHSPSDTALHNEEIRRRRHEAQQKRRARRQPFWKWARRIAGVLLLLGVVELVVAALTAPDFQVRAVNISGADITPRTQLTQIGDSLTGQNWVRARTADAVERLAALPTVKEARVTRELAWPPRLAIHIEERRPFVRVGYGEVWWIVDENGVPFRRADKRDEGLYAVTSPKLQPRLGQPLSGEAWQRAALITKTLEEEKHHGQSWTLRRVYLDKDDFASLRLTGGAHDELLVRLGDSRWPEKLERARQALEYFEKSGQRAQVLNLVSYNRPAWTPHYNSSHSSTPPQPQSSAPDELSSDDVSSAT